jgi:hypothetical protein
VAIFAPTRVRLAELNVRPQFEGVSIVALIATPERYDGKPVSVSGYVVLGAPLDHWILVYLHEEDATHGLMKNALWLGFSEGGPIAVAKNIDAAPGYASIDGVFHAPRKGQLPGLGGISPVSRLWFTPRKTKSRTRRQSQRADRSRRVLLYVKPIGSNRLWVEVLHAARPLRSWLIFDVRHYAVGSELRVEDVRASAWVLSPSAFISKRISRRVCVCSGPESPWFLQS